MIYQEPTLESIDLAVLDLIKEQRSKLKAYIEHSSPTRWSGSLRKSTFARAIRGSNSIEGYNATLNEAIAAVDEEEPPLDEKTETWFAINGYRKALTYIMQSCEDEYFEFSKQYLKSLHFMITDYSMNNRPGKWRMKPVFVINEDEGDTVYEGPEPEVVDSLISLLIEYLKDNNESPVLVRAAMAHLNLAMIHPFKDGNGRMARALQTLVLSREGLLHPVFSSIEEWLGKNTLDYYAILQKLSNGSGVPNIILFHGLDFV